MEAFVPALQIAPAPAGIASRSPLSFPAAGAVRGAAPAAAAPPAPATVGSVLALGAASTAVAVAVAAVVAASSRRAGRQRRRVARAVATVAAPAPAATQARKDLTNILPDCPRTIWTADNIDVDNLPPVEKSSPLVIDATEALQGATEAGYFSSQRNQIMAQLQDHGAILFKNFQSTRETDGFRTFYESLKLNPCLDPIHTSGLREMIGKKDAVYEAVNKPSLAQHFVGLHNESTFVKTATFGAFVCLEPASAGGGEFLLADGAKIIEKMDKDVLKRIYERKVRISVSNLDLNFIDMLPTDGMKEGVATYLQELVLGVVAPKFQMDLEMVYGADGSNPRRLQAIEHAQSPINTHPVTGRPVWFCNLHNHSRYLRDRRPCTIPEVGMTDVYHGDLGKISPADVEHINKVCEECIVPIMMEKGDVVLLDNYRVLHGREIFKGSRKHAVTWFESQGEPLKADTNRERPDDFMNTLINKTLV